MGNNTERESNTCCFLLEFVVQSPLSHAEKLATVARTALSPGIGYLALSTFCERMFPTYVALADCVPAQTLKNAVKDGLCLDAGAQK